MKSHVLVAALMLPAVVIAQTGPRLMPVAENQRTDEQRTIAYQSAASGMANAVGSLLAYPALASNCSTC